MLWPLSVVLVANTNGRLAIPALAGLLVYCDCYRSHFCLNVMHRDRWCRVFLILWIIH